ncbi:MAG: ATP-binding protein [Oceanococcaceae bacterium]
MYRRKIILVAILAVAIVGAAALLAMWSVRSTERHLSQAEIAHNLLAEHLQLSVRSYRLFKQLTDEILIGHAANQSEVRNKRAIISVSLARIRDLELEQRNALGADAAPGAVEDTDALEALIDTIIAEFESLLALPPGAPRGERVTLILEDRIDVSFREAVNAALERQQGVVRTMNQRVDRVHIQLVGLSAALALAALFGALGASQLLVRGIARPLEALQEGARRLGQGDFDHRVPRGFDTEFDQMAAAFNGMAEQLSAQHASREDTRRQLEEAVEKRTRELTEANAALQRADDVRRHFFADVSHELRTPLTVIRGEAQVALRAASRDPEEYREALQAVLDQSVGLSRLVEDMLFIARADAQTIRLNRRPIDPAALTTDILRELRRVADARQVTLEPTPVADGPALLGDPDRLRQLLIILVDNAVRYSPAGGVVTVRWTPREQDWELAVEDCGSGIDPQDLPYIFDRFFRGHGETNDDRASTGLGLGLAVAKAIVVAHGGQIQAESAPGAGCTIRTQLPAAR